MPRKAYKGRAHDKIKEPADEFKLTVPKARKPLPGQLDLFPAAKSEKPKPQGKTS